MIKQIASIIIHSLKNLYYKYTFKNLIIGYRVILSKDKFGENVFIGNYTQIYNSEFGICSYVGEYSFINNCTIGNFCSIGPNVRIGPGNHPTEKFVSTSPYFYSPIDYKNFSFSDKHYFIESKNIFIGSDVWIGCNVTIIDGVSIGDGAIIASGAVVTKDVTSYSIVGGIPAKLIKYRFSDDDIKFLLALKWWNKDLSWLRSNFLKFHDISEFKNFIKETR